MPAAQRRFTVIDHATGEVADQTPRTPHQFDGRGYSMAAMGAEVPLYKLGLSGTEWSVLDWAREHGAAAGPIKIDPKAVGPEVGATATTAKTALARLVKLGLLLKPSPRSGSYQLTPRRFWEGSGYMQLRACQRLDPPRVIMDEKAQQKTEKKAAPRPRRVKEGGK